jgi:hypothetical protein
MRHLVRGALLGAAVSIAFKMARLRGLLSGRAQLQQIFRWLRPSPSPTGDLERLTKAELYEEAQAEDLAGRSDMTKDELIVALRAKRRQQDG